MRLADVEFFKIDAGNAMDKGRKEGRKERVKWKVFKSISDTPGNIWDEKISEGHPARSSKFLRVLERACSDREYSYFVSYEQDQIISCCLVTLNHIDGCIFLTEAISRWVKTIRKVLPRFMVFKIIMTGTMETTGRHWWYNWERLTWENYVDALIKEVFGYFNSFHLIIFRDFLTNPALQHQEVSLPIKRNDFKEIQNLPLAVINIDSSTEDVYLKTIKPRDRATIRKAYSIMEQQSLSIEFLSEFDHLVDEMYPLYLAVNSNAKEMKTQPLSKEFFKVFNEELSDCSSLITIRDKGGRMIGFVLSLENSKIVNPYFIGLDYKVARQFYLFYTSIWLVLCQAIRKGRSVIDLGVTNYFIKQGLGATLQPMLMFVRFHNPILNRLLRPFIPAIFQPKLPAARSSPQNMSKKHMAEQRKEGRKWAK